MNPSATTTLYLITGIALVLVGFAGVLVRRHALRLVLGFGLVDTGVHLLIAALGSHPGRTAPILDGARLLADPGAGLGRTDLVVDPVPQALVLTAIVIGVGVTALMLTYAVRLHAQRGSLDMRDLGRLKW